MMKILITVWTSVILAGSVSVSADDTARLLERSGVQGGVAVVLGCRDAEWLQRLGRTDRYLVQGLTRDPETTRMLRQSILAAGRYGRVSVDTVVDPTLPYADDLINLMVVLDGYGEVDAREIDRVLCPGGVVLFERPPRKLPESLERVIVESSGWQQAVKRPTEELDDWSHLLHGPGNNAVSSDLRVGPARGLKWTCGPLWSRSHEFTSSVNVLLSAGGRVFYVVDQGLTSLTTPEIPEQWSLVARDAFNGKQLWSKPLPQWRSRLGSKTALRSVPATAQRCLVADRDRLYIAPRLGDPVRVLDAATGRDISVLASTEGAREFVKVGSRLLVVLPGRKARNTGRVACVDVPSGELRWTAGEDGYRAESLAANPQYVIYDNGRQLICLSAEDGRRKWPQDQAAGRKKPTASRGARATSVLHDDLVVQGAANSLIVRNAESGAVLWQTRTGGGAMRGEDCFVARGCVWHAAGDQIVGYDLRTGKPRHTIDPTGVESLGHHLRCYRAKATTNYLITQYRGVEFVSITGGQHTQTDWTRGACSFGVVPANGLLYVPPNPCFCFPGVKIRGLNALCPEPAMAEPSDMPLAERLVRGPAFGRQVVKKVEPSSLQWPTYRHDAMRHGATQESVPTHLEQQWTVDLGTRPTPPVVADGKVYVAAKDRHSVHALDAATGRAVWSYTAGGRVDSPPTIYRPSEGARLLCMFGSADGWLVCVTADTGKLIWKFRAAPADRRIVVDDQLESVWPVHGSVLVSGGVVYCTAGRSTMLDGGIWLYGLRPDSGEVLYQTNVNTLRPTREDSVGQPFIPSYVMEGGRSDILVCEADRIYMGRLVFDRQLNRLETPFLIDPDPQLEALDISDAPYTHVDADMAREGYQGYREFHRWEQTAWPKLTAEYGERYGGFNLGDMTTGPHIAPTAGFLDDSWFNRTYWMYSNIWPGWYHAHRGAKCGQLLVVGPNRTYAVQAYPDRNRQSPLFAPGTYGYLLLADENDNEPVLDFKTRMATKGLGYTRQRPPVWYDWVPIRTRAMVQAGDVLFIAGPPDTVPKDDPLAALEGRRGAFVRALAAGDGTVLGQLEVKSPPAFDALIAADGCLFYSGEDHHVVCLGAARQPRGPDRQAELDRLRRRQAERRKQLEQAARSRKLGGK